MLIISNNSLRGMEYKKYSAHDTPDVVLKGNELVIL